MTADDFRWIIGIAVTVVISVGGLLAAAFRSISSRIDTQMVSLRAHADTQVAELHGRVNKVKDDYVRRDDMDKHMTRIDGNVNELRREFRDSHEDTNRKLDAIMERLPPRS